LILAAAAFWIVHPKGSKINLSKLKIKFYEQFSLRLGLDLQGGSHLVYQADFKDIKQEDRKDALTSARDTIERRVNSFGVSEPQVVSAGEDRIIIELPGISDINEAIKQIGQTPFLDFRAQTDQPPSITPDESGQVEINPADIWKPTGLSGKQLKRAAVDLQNFAGFNEPSVRLEFDDEGKQLFADITKANINKQVAIFLDGQIISAPRVDAVIDNGVAYITGNFTSQEAKELATRLNSGALPVPISLISQQNVGATLGKQSIHSSVLAGLIGLLLIAVFMISYYRFPGFLAVCALLVYALLSLAVFKIGISFAAVALVGLFFFLGLTVSYRFGLLAFASYIILMLLKGLSPVTLTLAGIAGFILSIGMAVDANVLIFERMKEELKLKRPKHDAFFTGFARAWTSIRDSNVASLITTVILFNFGTGPVRGFALTLAIGILVSMFSAITVTRTFLRIFWVGKI
jgi:protein-export membrane protein SecD